MRAMILAAGRGERMGNLTSYTPKALLPVVGRPLIEYSLLSLVKLGIEDIIVNVCYRREQIKSALGDGSRYGVRLHYSEETEALETGGGICRALPLLGTEPFIVLSCDIITDFPLQTLLQHPKQMAHLVLVENPSYHPRGDFSLAGNKIIPANAQQTFTFANIGIYRPELFANCVPGHFRLGDLLKQAVTEGQLTGEFYSGFWHNLGTPQQLLDLNAVPDSLP
jgi:MurNAc alpha-1-phosphate uridylyltransferase